MATNRTLALTVTDDASVTRNFSLYPSYSGPTENSAIQSATRYGKSVGFTVSSRPWEPDDGAFRWRKALHPWDGGVYESRLGVPAPRTYSKGNCDASWSTLMFPPKLNSTTLTNGSNPRDPVEFNGKVWWGGGRYMYYFDPATNTATEDKDFGVGKAAVSWTVFNNELIVAMGETEKIWTRTTSTWTQAADNTFAIALGVVDAKLWRAETTNRVSSCTTAPRTLTSWIPSGTGAYSVGDTTWAIHTIKDYGGIPFVFKGDGVYAPDPQSRFKNQAPQLRQAPHADNGKGAFTAHGYLWVPTSSGMLRLKPGQSVMMGPELTHRPGYRFWVRGGVEIGGVIYLLCTDEAAVGATAVFKMIRDVDNITRQGNYIVHEWCRMAGTTKGYGIAATTVSTNPKIIVGYGNDLRWLKLGRGGGRDVDDANYDFGTAMELETGRIQPASDLGLVSTLVGVDTVLDYSRGGESLTISYVADRIKESDAYTGSLLNTQEGGGSAAISSTTNYQKVTRYAPAQTDGQFFEFKFAGTLTSAAGTTRPEILEAWAHGFTHPVQTHIVHVGVVADDNVWVNGVRNGIGHDETIRLWQDWMNRGVVLTCKIQTYEENHVTRFRVLSVEAVRTDTSPGQNVTDGDPATVVQVSMMRVDYANNLAVHD